MQTWWYGGESSSPGIYIVLDIADERIFTLSPLSFGGVTGTSSWSGRVHSNRRRKRWKLQYIHWGGVGLD